MDQSMVVIVGGKTYDCIKNYVREGKAHSATCAPPVMRDRKGGITIFSIFLRQLPWCHMALARPPSLLLLHLMFGFNFDQNG